MRKIIHIDADCFYAAVEMRDNPALRQIPMAVGGRSGRGVISTCNYYARQFGIRSAMSSIQALRLCPELQLVPTRMAAYKQVSQQMRAIFLQYTPKIEPLSLDEAYLDVTDCPLLQGSATRIAQKIRLQVQQQLQITVSAGVASNKLLAKIASDWNKPDALVVIRPEQTAEFMAQLPVHYLPGVGPVMQEKLQQQGITHCGQLRQTSLAQLVERHGKFGQRLWHYAHGEDTRAVSVNRQRRSLSIEHTYESNLTNLLQCEHNLNQLVVKLQQRLQQQAPMRAIKSLAVKLKFSNFQITHAESAQLPLQCSSFISF